MFILSYSTACVESYSSIRVRVNVIESESIERASFTNLTRNRTKHGIWFYMHMYTTLVIVSVWIVNRPQGILGQMVSLDLSFTGLSRCTLECFVRYKNLTGLCYVQNWMCYNSTENQSNQRKISDIMWETLKICFLESFCT